MVFIVTIVWISLASEVVEDFLELVALLLELGLDFVDEGVETSLIGIQAPLELDGGQGERGTCGAGALMTSSSWIVTDCELWRDG